MPAPSSSSPAGPSSECTTSPASAPSLPSADQQACIVPPSVRRREARIARCAYVAANNNGGQDRQAAADGGDGGEHVEEQQQAEERERTAYEPEEVAARRRYVRETRWAGWEAALEAYTGPQLGEGSVVRPDGTVDWAVLPSLPATGGWAGEAPEPVFPVAAGETDDFDALLRSVDALPSAPPPPSTFPRLALPPALDNLQSQLPANTLPVLLGALYVAARAMGVGSRRQRNNEGGAAAEKVRRF
ncbi:hypothetical protein JCM8097_003752 [Rhodosporidiobolus ruineniae]